VQVFGADRVITTHSKLTAKERNLAWLRMLQSTEPLIVLGPRSALFSPLRNVGLIILDESHEGSYKQEQAPHYHTSKVAAALAAQHKAILVLGSATPSITDVYLAQARDKPIIRMHAKAADRGAASPETNTDVHIEIVDLKERSQFTRQPHLSNKLLDTIAEGLQRNEQSLVFLNRRGTARIMLCENCGWQALCPHCDLPLTYHGDSHSVRCHTCGHVSTAANSCPECKSANIILKSIGTKAIVGELEHAFPHARIQRFDTDNTKEERLEAHYEAVRAGEVDIIVGTQLIAKGLDLPKLTTVGVVVADTSLYLPDYSSGERSYQLLRQVIGRVGRGHQAHNNVIIQTYEPDSPIIQAAVLGDWDSFYATEIQEREAFMFPPFCHTLKIWCRRATSKAAQTAAEKVVEDLSKSGLRITIDGPTPAFYEKTAGKYQWQANIKTKDRSQLIEVIRQLPANWSYDIDPTNLL
jgi:primosomal protein N' (replication factor Y)